MNADEKRTLKELRLALRIINGIAKRDTSDKAMLLISNDVDMYIHNFKIAKSLF